MIVFSGDRKSLTIFIGKKIKKIFPKSARVMLWDGYKSKIYFEVIK
jgi:hypothetical protein